MKNTDDKLARNKSRHSIMQMGNSDEATLPGDIPPTLTIRSY